MGESIDIAVIGAGFSGVGLALEASRNGFSVMVFESEAGVGSKTSQNSLRIVHGGFRYLQNGALGRVRRSAQALSAILRDYPQFVSPLRSLLPLSAWGLKSHIPVRSALMAYHSLAGTPLERRGRILSATEFEAEIPLLRGHAPHGALQWWDGRVLNPVGLLEYVAEEARQLGAVFAFRSTVQAVAVERGHALVHLRGAASVKARVVYNAAGPFVQGIETPGILRQTPRWCRGFNLVVGRQLHPVSGVAGVGKGRLLFAVPRDAGTALGTWYLPLGDGAQGAEIREEEIVAALQEVHAAYPGFEPRIDDVLQVETGVLPLGHVSSLGEPIPLGQETSYRAGRYVELLSTKFTTFLPQAKQLLRASSQQLAES